MFFRFVYELSHIRFNVLNLNVFRGVVNIIFEGRFWLVMLLASNMFTDNNWLSRDLSKIDLTLNKESDKVNSRRIKPFKSAGVRGLYVDPGNLSIIHGEGNYSFRNKFKSRLL